MMKLIVRIVYATFFFALGLAPLPGPAPHSARAEAEPRFAKKKIKIANQILSVEIADSDEKRSHGLMFRKSLGNNSGMLFIFPQERGLSFWMKNTLIPLAIGYFDKDKKLIEVHEMVPAIAGEAFPPSYPSSRPAMFALEVPKGWFDRHKVPSGTAFSFID